MTYTFDSFVYSDPSKKALHWILATYHYCSVCLDTPRNSILCSNPSCSGLVCFDCRKNL